jgi:hypothetical protein
MPWVDFGNGVKGHVCSRGQRRHTCSVPHCGRRAPFQCDYPVARKGKDTTCDAWLCDAHRKSQGPEIDYCPAHAEHAAKKAEAAK